MILKLFKRTKNYPETKNEDQNSLHTIFRYKLSTIFFNNYFHEKQLKVDFLDEYFREK